MNPIISMDSKSASTNIKFHCRANNREIVEMLKLSQDGFYYMGEKVEDAHKVYQRFNEWMMKMETPIVRDVHIAEAQK